MNTPQEDGYRQKLLHAALQVSESKPLFSLTDLVLAAWKSDPVRFGLAGHPEHPDSHRVAVCLSRPGGPVLKQRWLERVSQGFYRLTAEGISEAEKMGFVANVKKARRA